jgi:hypothetical protein
MKYKFPRAMICLVFLGSIGCGDSPDGRKTANGTSPNSQRVDDASETDANSLSNQDELLPGGERITTSEFSVVVPTGWKNDSQFNTATKKLFIVGDGKGVPIFDDMGSPLQLGMEVEHFSEKDTLANRIKLLTEDARTAPARKLESEPEIEEVQLTGDTQALLMHVEMIKEEYRRSLYMKLVAQDQAGTIWVTTGWIVASKESKLPRKDSVLAKRMRTFVQSFELAKKKESLNKNDAP